MRYLGVVIATLGCLLAYFHYTATAERALHRYAGSISTRLQTLEGQLLPLLQDTDFLRQLMAAQSTPLSPTQLQRLETAAQAPYTIVITQEDSVVAATNYTTVIEFPLVQATFPALMMLGNGQHLVHKRVFMTDAGATMTAWGCVPLRYQYDVVSDYLNAVYEADKDIPTAVVLQTQKTPFAISNVSGQRVAYLHARLPFQDLRQQQYLLWTGLLLFIAIGVGINRVAYTVAMRYQVAWGVGFLIMSILALRGWSILGNWADKFDNLPLFVTSFHHSFLNSSLGDLLINIILFLWVMLFGYKVIQEQSSEHLTVRVKLALTLLYYEALILSLLVMCGLLRSMVLYSDISFELDNIMNLDRYSLLASVCIILLMLSLFLLSQRMMTSIISMGFSRGQRLVPFAVALVIAIPIIHFSDLYFSTPIILLAAIFYIGMFDIFVDREPSSFTWLIIWILVFSSFASLLLYIYDIMRDIQHRTQFAKQIAVNVTKPLPQRLEDIYLALVPEKAPVPLSTSALEERLHTLLSKDEYLAYNYTYFFYKSTPEAPATAVASAGVYDFSLSDSLKIRFLPIKHEHTNVYEQLLGGSHFQKATKKYSYAIYKNDRLIDANNPAFAKDLRGKRLPPIGQFSESQRKTYSEVVYHATADTVILVGKDVGLIYKLVPLFAYMFLALIVSICVLTVLNTFLHFLPSSLHLAFHRNLSLRARVQVVIIGAIIGSFVLIAGVTIYNFKKLTNANFSDIINQQKKNVAAAINGAAYTTGGAQEGLSATLQYIRPLSRVHQTDLTVYDLRGKLIYSSTQSIFTKNLLAPTLSAYIVAALGQQQVPEVLSYDRIGTLTYRTLYIPLKNSTNATLAYVGMSFPEHTKIVNEQVVTFIGGLLNIYTFLLLIASAMTIGLASSITKPLTMLSDRLKLVRLGGKNEPIQYSGEDEVSELVQEYNNMLVQLEESAAQLAKAKREEAWRIMAQQVGHEFSNPLTSMKLNLQWLQYRFQSNQPVEAQFLNDKANMLLDEIDTLTKIASNFRDFAKMPTPVNERLHLNQLVEQQFDLFKQQSTIDWHLSLPEDNLYAFADKDHIKRILTNLLKNAIQALPFGKQGRIEVSLYTEDPPTKAVIRVQDNGSGIPPERKDLIFEPHFTTKNTGTGIGLYMCRAMIEDAGGRIYFESEAQVGTVFFVIIPIMATSHLNSE